VRTSTHTRPPVSSRSPPCACVQHSTAARGDAIKFAGPPVTPRSRRAHLLDQQKQRQYSQLSSHLSPSGMVASPSAILVGSVARLMASQPSDSPLVSAAFAELPPGTPATPPLPPSAATGTTLALAGSCVVSTPPATPLEAVRAARSNTPISQAVLEMLLRGDTGTPPPPPPALAGARHGDKVNESATMVVEGGEVKAGGTPGEAGKSDGPCSPHASPPACARLRVGCLHCRLVPPSRSAWGSKNWESLHDKYEFMPASHSARQLPLICTSSVGPHIPFGFSPFSLRVLQGNGVIFTTRADVEAAASIPPEEPSVGEGTADAGRPSSESPGVATMPVVSQARLPDVACPCGRVPRRLCALPGTFVCYFAPLSRLET